MTVRSLKDEDKLPMQQIINAINKKMEDVIRVVDALNLGRTEVKKDGVYRTFNDGKIVKIADGVFKKKHLKNIKKAPGNAGAFGLISCLLIILKVRTFGIKIIFISKCKKYTKIHCAFNLILIFV